MKFAPTSANTQPMRLVFVHSREAKERLKPALMPQNVRSNFLVNLGYGDPAGLFPRNPRLDFDAACRIE